MRQEPQEKVENAETLCDMRKVLIFDEDIEGLTQLAKPFEAQGFEVHKCMSVETAKRCLEREEFDFALVDQGSPAFEGLRVLRHLVRYNRRTPFVVVARCKDLQCYQQALALGAVDYFEKPVPKAEMDRIIHDYLGTSLKKRIEAEKFYEL
jgi:DNA-binding NtrC family response regulator